MWCSRSIAAAVLAAILSGSGASAAAKPRLDNPRPPVVHNPRPVSVAASSPRPATPPPRSRAAAPARNSNQSNSHHDGDRHHDGRRSYARPGVYVPYYGYYYPYTDYGYWPSLDSFGLGSSAQDTTSMDNAAQPWPNGGAPIAEPPPADKPPEPPAAADRANNPHWSELAGKYIGYGDALFAKQKYVEANDRYRSAARSAPQLAVAWFRQGFALAAIGRYDQAAAAIKRGLKLDPAWPKSIFHLDQLFGGNAAAKNARLDALDAAVKEKPADPDRLFVLGVFLHFDGQANRAAAIFARAEQTVGNNIGHIEAFMAENN